MIRLKMIWRLLTIAGMIWLLLMVGLAIIVYLYGQQEDAQPADVIIILGSGLNPDKSPGDALKRRSLKAAVLWQQGKAPAVLCTGGHTQGYTRSEASGCKEILLQAGVPEAAIWLEEQSRSTEENAIYSRAIMEAQGWQTALIVSDSFHLLRANWIFDTYGISHTLVSTSASVGQMGTGWYALQLIREVIALQWQAFKDLLHLPVTSVPFG